MSYAYLILLESTPSQTSAVDPFASDFSSDFGGGAGSSGSINASIAESVGIVSPYSAAFSGAFGGGGPPLADTTTVFPVLGLSEGVAANDTLAQSRVASLSLGETAAAFDSPVATNPQSTFSCADTVVSVDTASIALHAIAAIVEGPDPFSTDFSASFGGGSAAVDSWIVAVTNVKFGTVVESTSATDTTTVAFATLPGTIPEVVIATDILAPLSRQSCTLADYLLASDLWTANGRVNLALSDTLAAVDTVTPGNGTYALSFADTLTTSVVTTTSAAASQSVTELATGLDAPSGKIYAGLSLNDSALATDNVGSATFSVACFDFVMVTDYPLLLASMTALVLETGTASDAWPFGSYSGASVSEAVSAVDSGAIGSGIVLQVIDTMVAIDTVGIGSGINTACVESGNAVDTSTSTLLFVRAETLTAADTVAITYTATFALADATVASDLLNLVTNDGLGIAETLTAVDGLAIGFQASLLLNEGSGSAAESLTTGMQGSAALVDNVTVGDVTNDSDSITLTLNDAASAMDSAAFAVGVGVTENISSLIDTTGAAMSLFLAVNEIAAASEIVVSEASIDVCAVVETAHAVDVVAAPFTFGGTIADTVTVGDIYHAHTYQFGLLPMDTERRLTVPKRRFTTAVNSGARC